MRRILPGEPEIVQQMKDGDALAFRKLYEVYQGRIFVFAFRFTKSKHSAEEIVQQVFVKLWERKMQVDVQKNFASYLISIAKNLLIDGLKKAAVEKEARNLLYQHIQSLQHSSIDDLLKKELSRLYQQALDNLSPQKKMVYLLSREEELSYEQIARQLNISRNTVRNHMTESLRSIREYLSSHPEIACTLIIAFFKAV